MFIVIKNILKLVLFFIVKLYKNQIFLFVFQVLRLSKLL